MVGHGNLVPYNGQVMICVVYAKVDRGNNNNKGGGAVLVSLKWCISIWPFDTRGFQKENKNTQRRLICIF